MQIVAVGVSHNSTTIGLRERLAVPPDELPDTLARLRDVAAEAFILSTCNRVELYAVCGHEATGADKLRHVLATHGGVSLETVRNGSYVFGHRSAVQHLLRVAGGLDSMIVGESEILGQVRRALASARQVDALGPLLDRLGNAALGCGKRVRSSTALGSESDSIASVGLRLAAGARGSLDGAQVVVLGAGETATMVVEQLSRTCDARLTVVNRSFERAAALAAAHNAEALPWIALANALSDADVVIGCTAAVTPVVDATLLRRARGTSQRPLLCLDLGMPRDIDLHVRSLPGVTLIDLPDIEADAAARRAARTRDLVHAEAIVAQETDRYMEWWRGRGVASTIAQLHTRADAIRHAEVERTLARLPELSTHEREIVIELATRVVAKLLHEPTLALKQDPEGANMAVVVERLFALSEVADLTASVSDECPREHRTLSQDLQQESIAS